ncbi:MAG TPA: 3-hydroxybutyryl-CoA dehydrogenase [Candidatus Sulfotelmatobacter sp.]|nr:3-hydroxybutyryl-CoA dehydrogenase [Candidatus Sulfotelmatobacter sp.]
MTIKKVGVVGCGLMGGGIAQVTAEAGYPVVVREVTQPLLDKGLGAIKKNLDRSVEKGRMTAEARDKALANLKGTTSLEDLKDCDLIIEAIVENIEEKKQLFAALDALCPPHTIIASNTSSCTVIEMAAATKRMDRVVGLHFFNPVPMMKLVEVVRTIQTGEATFRAAWDFAKSVGKEPVAAKDTTGFVVNLLLVPYLLDAIRALERGVASVVDMDKAMKLGCGYPMGPFTLLDFVGLDTTLHIGDIMFAEFRDARYAPPPLLRRMVLAGMHGRKSGKGFYDYSGAEPKPADLGL